MPDTELSVEEFEELKAKAIDPKPMGPVRRAGMNSCLTDEHLVLKIKVRNKQRKPAYLLLLEYKTRLEKLGLL